MWPTSSLAAMQTISGLVTKAGVMSKTVTLTVERKITHPKLLKTYIRHKKYLIHDEADVLKVGDRILAGACRPLSARKHFTFLERLGGGNASAERRATAERMMSAEDREKIRIEQVVKTEVRKKATENAGKTGAGKSGAVHNRSAGGKKIPLKSSLSGSKAQEARREVSRKLSGQPISRMMTMSLSSGAVRSALGCRQRPSALWLITSSASVQRCHLCPRRSISFSPQISREARSNRERLRDFGQDHSNRWNAQRIPPSMSFTGPVRLSPARTSQRLMVALKQLVTDSHHHLGDRLIAFGVKGEAVRWIWAQMQRKSNWKHPTSMSAKAVQAEDSARAEVEDHKVAARLFREWAAAARADLSDHKKHLEELEREKEGHIPELAKSWESPSGLWEMHAAGEALRIEGDAALPRTCMTVFLDWLEVELAAVSSGKPAGPLAKAPITRFAQRTSRRETSLVASANTSLATLALVRKAADLRDPALAYPSTRTLTRHVHLHVGPTNSGKTHSALMALSRARTGVYAGPLRLLAHEVWDRINSGTISEQLPPRPCNLVTGEEQRTVDPLAGLVSCTVEMAPISIGCDVAVIDEIQMLSDPNRGFAWTKAVLGIPAKELHLCGEASAVPLVRKMIESCGDILHVHNYERLTPLRVEDESLVGDMSRVEKGDCVVTFSRSGIFALKKQIEEITGLKCALAYGALPPETKSEQARLFNDPQSGFDVMVASDAIGMGLNLKIKRVVFETLSKFNGSEQVTLSASQIKQIAGRAGRFGTQEVSKDGKAAAPGGTVTTLLPKDLPTLKAALAMPVIPLPRAAIQPNEDTLQQMSLLLPPTPRASRAALVADERALRAADVKDKRRFMGGAKDAAPPAHSAPPSGSLSSLYADVGLLARLDSSTYFLSEFSQQHAVSPLIERATRSGPRGTTSMLTVAEREAIANAPANLRDERVAAVLSIATEKLARGELVRFGQVEAGLGMLDRLEAVEKARQGITSRSEAEQGSAAEHDSIAMRDTATSSPAPHVAMRHAHASANIFDTSTLVVLESLHRSLTLYLWLSYRFPLAFCFRDEVKRIKERAELAIDFCLRALREGSGPKQRAPDRQHGDTQRRSAADGESARWGPARGSGRKMGAPFGSPDLPVRNNSTRASI